MARNPGKVYEVKETGKMAFSYNREQTKEIMALNKILVYITEVSQLNLFDDLPPVDTCRHVLKDATKLKLVGFID